MVNIAKHPKNLFLIDGVGALLSAFLLGVVLVRFNEYFGIPIPALYWLAFFPCLFVIYDVYAYKQSSNARKFLKGIALMNFLYCCLSLVLAFVHMEHITYLGWAYILVEILIVLTVAYFEYKEGSKYDSNGVKQL